MKESKEVRNERLMRQTVRQLVEDLGIDGYAADAIVRAAARDRHHPWTEEILRAGMRGVALAAGIDVSLNRVNAAYGRASRAVAEFSAEMAATYAEIDDEFRNHPDVIAADAEMRRWYGDGGDA